jgi:hypothetical protein
MFAGVLLLLKERLARAHPSLIFKDVSHYGRPGAHTTNYDETLNRLKAVGVTIAPVKRAILDEIRSLRHAIEHYEVDLTLERSKEVICEMAAFVYGFCEDELGVYIEEHLSHYHALGRFTGLKEVGDRLMEAAIASANADAEADDRYFAEFGTKYTAMTPAELLAYAEGSEGGVYRTNCSVCREDDTALLLEVAVCLNDTCRAWYRTEACKSCQGPTMYRSYLCEQCHAG